MNAKLLSLVVLLATLLGVSPATAQSYPTTASDGLFVGVRAEPGAALSLAYDLDIYLTGDRVLSLGPAVSFSFLSDSGSDFGRRQDALLQLDFLRLKVGLAGGNSRFRPHLLVGGGMYYAWLPEQRSAPRDVFVLPSGEPATAELRFESVEQFGAVLSLGAGLDVYLVDNFAIAIALVGHLRLSDEDRVPQFWSQALIGIRFGL